jgi:hypothetical protein
MSRAKAALGATVQFAHRKEHFASTDLTFVSNQIE